MRQLSVATNILGASTMLQRHALCCYVITLRYAFLQRYIYGSRILSSIYILYTLDNMYSYMWCSPDDVY